MSISLFQGLRLAFACGVSECGKNSLRRLFLPALALGLLDLAYVFLLCITCLPDTTSIVRSDAICSDLHIQLRADQLRVLH